MSNGSVKTLSDVEMIDGFTEKTATKLFESILDDNNGNRQFKTNKIRGQVLNPTLSESLRQVCFALFK